MNDNIIRLAYELSRACNEGHCLKCPLNLGDRHCVLMDNDLFDWSGILYDRYQDLDNDSTEDV